MAADLRNHEQKKKRYFVNLSTLLTTIARLASYRQKIKDHTFGGWRLQTTYATKCQITNQPREKSLRKLVEYVGDEIL